MEISMTKADVERIKEKIRGLESLLKEYYRTNYNGQNNDVIRRTEKEIENLKYALKD